MSYEPSDILALVQKAQADAQALCDAYMKDDQFARAKGKSPEQIDARKRVAALFCKLHLPNEKPETLQPLLDSIDYESTVTTTNGRAVNMENPKATGMLGLGRKPAYIVSKAFPPHTPEEPIYALEYFPIKH